MSELSGWGWEVLEEKEGRMSGSMVPGRVWDSRREKKKNIFADNFSASTPPPKFKPPNERRNKEKEERKAGATEIKLKKTHGRQASTTEGFEAQHLILSRQALYLEATGCQPPTRPLLVMENCRSLSGRCLGDLGSWVQLQICY